MIKPFRKNRTHKDANTSVTAENPAGAGRIEYCVCCGKATPYTFDTPIDQREHYIVGAGQLCYECAKKLEREADIKFVEDC